MDKATLQLGGDNWAAKDSSLLGYAQGNVSNRYIPREFTFTRASTATRVNQNGLLEKSRENLLLASNNFGDTNYWSNPGTLTGGQTDKDDGNTAWLYTNTATGQGLYQSLTTSGVQTFSVYVKKNTTNGIRFYTLGSANVSVFFNLDTGFVTISNAIDTKIEAYNADWWRISVTFNISLTRIYLYPTNNGTANEIGSYTIQNAQLEQGLVATEYLETTSTTTKDGVVENLPRIDYSSGTPSLLFEPQRTNLVKYSEIFTGTTSGFYGGATITNDFTQINPAGQSNSVKASNLQFVSGDRVGFDTYNITAGNTYTASVYIKGTAGETTNYTFKRLGGTYVGFPITPITLDGTWQKIEATFTTLLDNTGVTFQIVNTANSTADVIYLYGAQIEEGSYATSYIPTYGASVTRVLEQSYLDDLISLGLITANTLTFFIDLNAESLIRESSAVDILFGDVPANGIFIYNNAINSINGAMYLRDSSSTEIIVLNSSPSKICVKVHPNDVKVFINGVNVATYTTLNFDFTANSKLILQSKSRRQIVNNVLFFPTALSDQECITLTTI